MRVKRLEIQGFKSFKDKTVIHFDHGITGIVGPNGCGKSNIVDAFFWVMGEQSYKHMRGTSSEDLIFNGSSKYTALGLAEATLVMETEFADLANGPAGASSNPDALPAHLRTKEISVTRKLYRTGEGEYFINGVQARLKDIQELFMDTGVGAKGYSVIEQGQIGKIVNAKPEDRRLLIEEAAGIAKYKARKKESLRKVEATQSNLSRLNDVIAEIERSLGSLERQAQKARQYKKYKEELLDKEMTWGRRKTVVFRQKLDSLKSQKEALERELLGAKAELQTSENSIEIDRIAQLTDTKAAEELQTQIQELADELAREKSALDLSRRRQNDLTTQLETLATEKTDLLAAIEKETQKNLERETESKTAEESFRSESERAGRMDGETKSLRSQVETERRELESNKRRLLSDIAQASELNSRAASLQSRAEAAKSQSEKLAVQTVSVQEKLEEATEECARTRTSSEEVKTKREKLKTVQSESNAKIQTLEQSLRTLEKDRDQASRQLTQFRSKLQSLEELDSAHEGFGDGPKAALDWAKENGRQDSVRAIADLFEVDAEYEVALQGWLEDRFESLVCSKPELALEIVSRLSEDKQGRTAIHVFSPEELSEGEKPALADASTVQKSLESAGFKVLGELGAKVKVLGSSESTDLTDILGSVARESVRGVFLVEDFAPLAKWLANAGHLNLGGWSLVNREGQAMDSLGILRGGSLSNDGTTAILKRKRAIQELQAQVSEAEVIANAAEEKAAEEKESLEAARARKQEIQSELQSLEVQSAGLERDLHQMSRALRDLEQQAESLAEESRETAEEAMRATEERASLEAEVSRILSARTSVETTIQAAEESLAARESSLREMETLLNQLRVSEASQRERAQSLVRELEAARSVIADRERRSNEITRVLERATREQEEFSGGESALEEKVVSLTQSLSGTRSQLSEVKDRIEQSSAKINASMERIKALHHTTDSKSAGANNLAIEVEKLSSDLAHLIQNLEEKYGPGCLERPVTSPIQEEMNEPVVTQEMTAEEEFVLGEEVERLRERLRRLGEVNVMAIEEYEELKKRYDYLLTEKGDLEQSIENLQEAIEHINKTSEERFRKAFEAIADRFERLFPIIFGGGQAKLSLVYPEGSSDILDAGVDILAQPPGKKIVNIGLLSGGEKALTAVSLIFAIFMVKPSPFCVLDEVDAPLDDANIGKFNALLREMSAKSQFILITHNKKTMELNDTLYGVTMEEPGVSKMVSIQMQ